MRSDEGEARPRTTPVSAHRDLPPRFVARHVTVAAGGELPYERREWTDAIVLVRAGMIELECLGGTRRCFGSGALLCFDSLPLRTLRNAGDEPALLMALSRFRCDR
jgi:hypothetical protein